MSGPHDECDGGVPGGPRHRRGAAAALGLESAAVAALPGGARRRVVQRCGLYAESGHTTFERARFSMAKAAGATQARNVLGANERHCSGPGSCLAETARGWQPLGALSLPGERLCLVNCWCTMEYR